ncbi:ATP-binding protein [Pseudomonas sp. SWRI100]|uniref:AAA family ATPase n=1 Tax=Pseudomonas TaxID=286 RepID=UPI0016440118|nr:MULTISPECIES: ATP-binding protein [Pseudomonas]MBC3499496.1 ATP-binding protein [Pseudomonas sp. SWRI67]MBV4524775.1 ATP-binding protein [Pseudomonas kermanshahensis]
MLKKFAVKGFKGFRDLFTFDLTQKNDYQFNVDAVENGVIRNSIVYGKNGCGKTNLSYALFDIVYNLGARQTNTRQYSKNYLNAANSERKSWFSYTFKFGDDEVTYSYEKESATKILKETVVINGKTCIIADRSGPVEIMIDLPGTETLNQKIGEITDLAGTSVSIVSYIHSNTILPDAGNSAIFKKFTDFVHGMLMVRSIEGNFYAGLVESDKSICEDIAERGKTEEFEEFLNKNGIKCKLVEISDNDGKNIAFDFDGSLIPFAEIASTGTRTLGLFYFWFIRIQEIDRISLVCIDEFDAFYHHELSINVVELLKKSGIQVILTTHNTAIMSNDILRADCYFVMDETRIVSLADTTDKEIRQAHNLEKIYKAGGFSLANGRK